ncbi:hypothetical protein A4A49_35688 [Nicotiana attenuata]|uniref:Uncharacterized protein n=1 Tax=Nicotiana attenuata TaxID=49451 RepID=A0A1J6JZ10_NICAT|nr:hypothetical protein A4A49_35688 [Nicotiana attenuata]
MLLLSAFHAVLHLFGEPQGAVLAILTSFMFNICFFQVAFTGLRQDLQKLTCFRNTFFTSCAAMWRHEGWVEEGRLGGGRKCTILSPEAMGFHCLIDIKVQGTDISLMHNKDKLHSSRSGGRHELTGLRRKLCDALP